MPEFSPDATAYLVRLRSAVADLPDGTDIVDGVREELAGLDQTQTRERLAALGDPSRIAAEARAVSGGTTPASAPARTVDVLLPTLLMIFGGVILPVVGTVVGMILVLRSQIWTRREKLIGALGPFILAALLTTALLPMIWTAPATSDNPLIPAPYDIVWSSSLVWIAGAAVSGLWLLIIGLRRR